jgi:type II secretory pathway pseudopilin PulG
MRDVERGCSLVEVLVALGIVAGGVTAVAQLMALGAAVNRAARRTTSAAVLAQQKMEELAPAAATGVEPSPSGTLARNVDGYTDTIEGVFTRRWSIDPLPGDASGAVVLQVVVIDARSPARVATRLVSVRTRQGF